MAIMRRILLLFVVCWFASPLAAEAKALYLCDDGTTVLLSDNGSLGCPAYAPQAELITVPDGATWADVQWAVATNNAEAFQPRTPLPARVRTDVCALWQDLNLRTDGGLDMETAEQTRRWLALSKIVTGTGLCEAYITKEVYPRF